MVQRFIGLMMAPGLCGSASLARWQNAQLSEWELVGESIFKVATTPVLVDPHINYVLCRRGSHVKTLFFMFGSSLGQFLLF